MDAVAAQDEWKFLGESIGFWVQTAVVLLGAAAAVLTIYVNGRLSRKTLASNSQIAQASNTQNEKIARQRATIDLIMAQRSDPMLSDAKKSVAEIHGCGGEFVALAAAGNESEVKRQHLLAILNNYEFIALGIREGALDDSIYKRAVHSQLIRDWTAMQPFILELRRQKRTNTLFQEFEFLARSWLVTPLVADSK